MEKAPPPFVVWLALPLAEGTRFCLSFADGSMSEPFSSAREATDELLAALENDKVSVLQAEVIEALIKMYKPLFNTLKPDSCFLKPILVRSQGAEDGDWNSVLQGLARENGSRGLH